MTLLRHLVSKLSPLLLLLSFATAGYTENAKTIDWKSYIPVTEKAVQADIMEIQSFEELNALAAKLQNAMKQNPKWAEEYIRCSPKGKPLPYHENLGLTQQEYKRLLTLTQKEGGLTLTKSGTIDIVFQPLKDGSIKISTKEGFPLNNIIISDKGVEIDSGHLTTITMINNLDEKAITGPWKGVKWGKDTVDMTTLVGEKIQFCLGKTVHKNQGIIYYDGKILKGSTTPPTQFTHILFFPLS